jgi:hypothetical protein
MAKNPNFNFLTNGWSIEQFPKELQIQKRALMVLYETEQLNALGEQERVLGLLSYKEQFIDFLELKITELSPSPTQHLCVQF